MKSKLTVRRLVSILHNIKLIRTHVCNAASNSSLEMEIKCINSTFEGFKVRVLGFTHSRKAVVTQLFQTPVKFVTLIICVSLSHGSYFLIS